MTFSAHELRLRIELELASLEPKCDFGIVSSLCGLPCEFCA